MKRFATEGLLLISLIFAIGISAGCGQSAPPADVTPAVSATPAVTPTAPNPPIDVQSGVAVNPPTSSAKDISELAESMKFGARRDPFSLTAAEQEFNESQSALALVSTDGNMPLYYQQPPEKQLPELQAQPYRRLSGILVGNSVLAIIDMGDGQPPRIVSPGEVIPGTDWKVISIDDDQAILKRGGDVLPHTISVPLEQPPVGYQGSGGQMGGNQPGAPGFGPGLRGGGKLGGMSQGGAPSGMPPGG